VKVGAVPKFLAITKDESKLLVSNWSSGDVSIVDLKEEKQVKKVKVGAHPRGIDITEDSKKAFVTIMGSTKLAEIDLESYDVDYIKDVGRSPRHLILGHHDSVIYVSLNSSNKVLSYNRFTNERKACKTSSGPRSMCLSPSGDFLYVVNYFNNTFSKINTFDMTLVEEVETATKPIGICGNWDDSEIWVACYSGKIEIFKDFHLDSIEYGNSLLGFDLSSYWPTKTSNKMEEENVEYELVENDTATAEIVKSQVSEEVQTKNITGKKKRNWLSEKAFEKNNKPTDCHYHVIAGSFSEIGNAHKRQKELEGKGYSAVVINGHLNYVSAACYDSRGAAEKGVSEIKADTGYSAWILIR
jgi:YVTN family beta-propeller protein